MLQLSRADLSFSSDIQSGESGPRPAIEGGSSEVKASPLSRHSIILRALQCNYDSSLARAHRILEKSCKVIETTAHLLIQKGLSVQRMQHQDLGSI